MLKKENELMRLAGEYEGTLTGLLAWELQDNLRELIQNKLKDIQERIKKITDDN